MQRNSLAGILGRIDFLLLFSVLALVIAGLLSIYSATHGADMIVKFQKQVFWAVLGTLLVVLVAVAPPRFFHYSAYIIYALSIVPLVLVLFLGKSVSGNAGWFGIGTFGIQPSEFAKIATVIALARFLSDTTTRLASFRDVGIAFGIVFVPWFLIFLQPDFGTGLVYWAVFLVMLFWAGIDLVIVLTFISPVIVAVLSILNLWVFLIVAVLVSILFYLIKKNLGVALLFVTLNLSVGFSVQYFYGHLPEYQKARIAVFLDPARAPKTAGYNVMQSKVAVGSGGMTGKGFLQGSQTQLRFVPEQWTDFIFCVPAEEFGFIGASFILLLFGTLFYRGLRIARLASYHFASVLAVGLTATLFIHTFVNIGMSLGLLPVVGIPLPFMSYGGSFFLTSMLAAGLLLHAHANLQRTE
jgi:rod shape determining protein RodA